MRIWTNACLAILGVGVAIFAGTAGADAQPLIALKSGESTELPDVVWWVNCRSIVVGNPEIEILEGPEEVTLALKPKMVVPRRGNCAKPVPGWSVTATAKDVKEPTRDTLNLSD
jgi:hypothetical protein